MNERTCRFILVLISSFCLLSRPEVYAQNEVTVQTPQKVRTTGVQYQSEVDSLALFLQQKPLRFFEGVSVSGDLLGAILYQIANYGQLEGAVRMNIKGTYFPVIELGLGHSDHQDDETDLHFKTSSPFLRVGCDYNLARDKRSGNRIFCGLRYAYTKITYDLTGPDLVDPVWGDHAPYIFNDLKSNVSWGELVFGLEAKIWKIFHVGWSLRYRMRLSQEIPTVGQAWYVPGYGKNDTHNLGGTFNLVFDI